MVGMDVFAVKRYAGDTGSDPKHHLSLLYCDSDGDWKVLANADLPFEIDEAVSGGSCRGFVYFMGENGKVIICNLITREWRVFPSPDYLPDSSMVQLESCGLGYDPISGDFKLFRNYIMHYEEELEEEEEVVSSRYLGSEDYTEIYSFKSGSWNKIGTPDASIMHPCAVYFDGSCYWTAVLELNFGGLEDDPCRYQILTFDIATERFGHLPFPQANIADRNPRSKVVEFDGSLAALIYGGPKPNDLTAPLHINLFVRRENTWEKLFDLRFGHVERPLGLGESRDGFILFLEGNKIGGQASELMVYNFRSRELKGLGIHDRQSHMIAIWFDLKTYRLLGSTPMAFVDNIVPSRSEIDIMSESRPRKKMKSGESDGIEEV